MSATSNASQATLDDVRAILVRSLGLEGPTESIGAHTPLLGELPELDSLGVLELAVALEEHFAIVVDDSDFTGAVFETVGSLAAFVEGEIHARR